jgi:hypothetical protein
MKTITYLTKDELLEKWGKVLDAGGGIANESVRLTTAQVLENTQGDTTAGSLVAEDLNTTGGAGFGTGPTIGAGDMRWPSIVIPTVRRIFPELVAHELFGVQPLSSSLGYAYAIRTKYDESGQYQAGSSKAPSGTEMGYNTMDGRFTGVSGGVENAVLTGNYWASYAGTASTSSYWEGQGAPVGTAEGAEVNTNYPMAKIDLVKGAVEAKSRKLAANWSPELAEDLANQHGVDVDAEMTSILTYEVQAGIDRQLLTSSVRAAINGGFTSSWTPVSADGRNQIERIGTLLTQVILKSNDIAVKTRRGAANWAVASSRVAGLLERMNNVPIVQGTTMPSVPQAGVGAITKVGLINNGKQLLLRDTFAPANAEYLLLGYKGATAQDAGIVYCPYIPLQLMRAIKDSDFSPEIGVRTRYGVFEGYNATNWDAGRYYHFIKITGLVDAVLQASGSRVFTY